jgi:hypothetical protein
MLKSLHPNSVHKPEKQASTLRSNIRMSKTTYTFYKKVVKKYAISILNARHLIQYCTMYMYMLLKNAMAISDLQVILSSIL